MQIKHIKPLILRRACDVIPKCKRHLFERKEKPPAALDYFITTPIFYVNACKYNKVSALVCATHLCSAQLAESEYDVLNSV